MTFEELKQEIIWWAEDRGIIQNSNPLAQAIKTTEEVAELLKALSKNDMHEAADAYGDTIVTLIIGAKIAAIELIAALNFEELKLEIIWWAEDKGIIQNSTPLAQAINTTEEVAKLLKALSKNDMDEAADAYADTIVTLIIGAEIAGIDLIAALGDAYNVIKDRKGYLTPDGIFVKES